MRELFGFPNIYQHLCLKKSTKRIEPPFFAYHKQRNSIMEFLCLLHFMKLYSCSACVPCPQKPSLAPMRASMTPSLAGYPFPHENLSRHSAMAISSFESRRPIHGFSYTLSPRKYTAKNIFCSFQGRQILPLRCPQAFRIKQKSQILKKAADREAVLFGCPDENKIASSVKFFFI